MTNEVLPKGWEIVFLGEAVIPRSERVSPASRPELAFIGMDHVESGTTRIIGSVPASTMRSSAALFTAGDIIYGRLRPYLNKIAAPNFDGLASAEFIVIPPNEAVDAEFLKYRLSAHDFVSFASHLNEGDRPRVSFDQIGSFRLWLPPKAEQRRIVAKIEMLLSELDKGVESLTTARAQLKTYRQALLKQAFEGRLTEQWRKDHADELESADQLLARIREEHAARHRQQLEDWKAEGSQWETDGKPGKRPRKPSAPGELASVPVDELNELPELPTGWHYIRLEGLGELGRGKSKHRPRNDPKLFGGGYPFIQTAEVKASGKLITEYSQSYNEAGLAQSKLWPRGTLCITIAANIAETGFLGMDACFPDSVVGFIPSEKLVSAAYIEMFIRSARARIEAYAPATAQKNINLGTLEQLIVPLCASGEQALIVSELEAQLSQIDQLEQTIATALQQAEALRQSILKRAFEGKLVPQDPNDEPAAELLARIHAERGSQPPRSCRAAQVEA